MLKTPAPRKKHMNINKILDNDMVHGPLGEILIGFLGDTERQKLANELLEGGRGLDAVL